MNFQFVPTIEIFMGLTKGHLSPTKVLMPVDMFKSFMADPRVRQIAKFQGADVEPSYSLPENHIEFQNAVEPTLPEFNGRFEIGKDIGTDRMGLPIDWKRVGV